MQVAELVPERFDQADAQAIKASLEEDGYAVIKDAATPAELEHARSLLWADLQATHSWDRNDPRTWTDASFDNPTGGTTNALEHADFIWYVRTLPGVLAGFAVAYDTDDLVAAYDRSAVNRPVECGEPSIVELERQTLQNPLSRVSTLHTHFNQDGFGDVPIYYALMPLWDMDATTGATVIAPGSHKEDKIDFINTYRREHQDELQDETDPARFLRPFTECGLVAGPVVGKAGDLLLFNTALYHGFGPPLAPYMASAPADSGGLLRCACIMSMAPRLLLSPSIIKARQLYYEVDIGTGGSVMGNNTEESARQILSDYAAAEADGTARKKQRSFADARPEVKKIVGDSFDFDGAPPESRSHATEPAATDNPPPTARL